LEKGNIVKVKFKQDDSVIEGKAILDPQNRNLKLYDNDMNRLNTNKPLEGLEQDNKHEKNNVKEQSIKIIIPDHYLKAASLMICRFFKSNKMKLKLTLLSAALLLGLVSCHKEIKSEKGGIDIISNVYFDASKGLDQMQSFHISKMSYSQDQLIEIVPDRSFLKSISSYF
jgi:hypothetical protein